MRYLEEALRLENEFAEHRRRLDLNFAAVQTSPISKPLPHDAALALSRKLVADARSASEFDTTRFDHDPDDAHEIAAEIDTELADLEQLNENGQLRVSQAVRHSLDRLGMRTAVRKSTTVAAG